MAEIKKYLTDESMATLIGEIKSYTNEAVSEISFLDINEDGALFGKANPINADTLGGQLPEHFATVEQIVELDEKISHQASAEHNHDGRYYQKSEVDTLLTSKADSTHNHDSAYDVKGAAAGALGEAKTYTDQQVADLITSTAVDGKISTHNTSADAHSDIRLLISELSTKVNNFLDVDDTTTDELSEVLELINKNKGTLESLTSGKVNVSDIVDNLTTTTVGKVLSANQGVELKKLIDALQLSVDGKASSTHGHAISEVTGLQDTLNAKAARSDLTTLQGVVDGKASAVHSHAISEVTDLQTALDAKATQTDLDKLSQTVSNKADTSALTTHITNADIHFTAEEREKLAGIADGANNIVVDTEISATSENPVQNKAIYTIVDTASQAILSNANTLTQHNTAITNLQTAVGNISAIPTASIEALFKTTTA